VKIISLYEIARDVCLLNHVTFHFYVIVNVEFYLTSLLFYDVDESIHLIIQNSFLVNSVLHDILNWWPSAAISRFLNKSTFFSSSDFLFLYFHLSTTSLKCGLLTWKSCLWMYFLGIPRRMFENVVADLLDILSNNCC